jgi:hypothetical protein
MHKRGENQVQIETNMSQLRANPGVADGDESRANRELHHAFPQGLAAADYRNSKHLRPPKLAIIVNQAHHPPVRIEFNHLVCHRHLPPD